MPFATALINGLLVLPACGVVQGNLYVNEEGRIAAITETGDIAPAATVIDAAGKYVLPGAIDVHTHLGRRGAEEFHTETCSAAVGGVTTVCSYERSSEGDYLENFKTVCQEAEQRAVVDFAFHLGLMSVAQAKNIPLYAKELGVTSFKFYMHYRGEEAEKKGLKGVDEAVLYEGMLQVARQPHTLLCVHAENIEISRYLRQSLMAAGRDDIVAWGQASPGLAEAEAINRVAYMARQLACPLYIVHLSSKEGLAVVKEWKRRYPRLYVETCPHYLTHTMETDKGKLAQADPPLRTREDIEALWEAVADGTIDVVGSDHVARASKQKLAPVWQAPSGFSGVGTLLPVLLQEGVIKRGIPLTRIAELTAYNPARLFGLFPRKGSLAVGSDADLTVIDLEREREVKAADLLSVSDFSIYDGWTIRGWPVLTMVRGRVVMRDGELIAPRGHGRYLRRA